MRQIILIFFICIAFIFQTTTYAVTWETTTNGFWNQDEVWKGGIAPSCTVSDTFIINHSIKIDQKILLNAGCLLLVNSSGSICGHETVVINTNAKISNYGIIKLDSLKIPGGIYVNYDYSDLLLTYQGYLSNGGALTKFVQSHMAVGVLFNCTRSEVTDIAIINSKNITQTKISPVPSNEYVSIITPKHNARYIEIYNLEGSLIRNHISLINGEAHINIEKNPSGIYFVKIFDEHEGLLETIKMLIQH